MESNQPEGESVDYVFQVWDEFMESIVYESEPLEANQTYLPPEAVLHKGIIIGTLSLSTQVGIERLGRYRSLTMKEIPLSLQRLNSPLLKTLMRCRESSKDGSSTTERTI